MKRIFISILCLTLAGLMLFSSVSCGFSVSADTTDLTMGVERVATDEGEVTEEFKTALANFSMTLFKGLVTKDSANDLVSPLSAILCLGMIANGSDNNTKAQMESAFGMSVEDLNKALYAYVNSLYSADDCKFNLANSLWVNKNSPLTINLSFVQANADWYDAQLYSAPFDDSTLNDINNWVKHYTNDMIEKIFDDLDADTMMVLINALAFDAKWATEYESEDIIDYDFTSYDGTTKSVKMLSSSENKYFSAENGIGFGKNYSGDKYSLVCLLPDKDVDIYDFINSLDGTKWNDIWASQTSAKVKVKMPEFSYSANMNLNDTLKAMGMTDMFSSCDADFSKMGECEQGSLFLSEVCQKTFIQVDRNGTKASAVTWGTIKTTAVREDKIITITLDRPFVYAIVDNATGLPLFVGAVTTLG